MPPPPQLGLGAAALANWARKQREKDPEKTGAAIAALVGVSNATYSDWINAGWLDGGNVPRTPHRRKIEEITQGAVSASLFDQDELRRMEAARVRREQSRGGEAA